MPLWRHSLLHCGRPLSLGTGVLEMTPVCRNWSALIGRPCGSRGVALIGLVAVMMAPFSRAVVTLLQTPRVCALRHFLSFFSNFFLLLMFSGRLFYFDREIFFFFYIFLKFLLRFNEESPSVPKKNRLASVHGFSLGTSSSNRKIFNNN